MPQQLKLHHNEMMILAYSQRQDLPSCPGIYYIGNESEPVMYVGLASNLKKRHYNHHRQSQFLDIEGATIRYQVLPEDAASKSNFSAILRHLELQAISHYQPAINNTPVPGTPLAVTHHGPIYVQNFNVSGVGYHQHFDYEDGEELGISTSKFSSVVRATEKSRPIFLIVSGSYEEYEQFNYPNLSELKPYHRNKIYLLVSRFIPYGYRLPRHGFNQYSYVYGDNSKVFIEPYLILNDEPGFAEFKQRYLSLGFTNCERSSFATHLLALGEFKLLTSTSVRSLTL